MRIYLSSMPISVNKEKSNADDQGFTLIEVMVAIFIGLIVMAMAVAILGVTNSTSLRVLSKSEAQQTTRASVVKILDNLSNAESLEQCRVGVNKDVTAAIIAFPARSSLLNDIDNCKETSSSGNVVIWAQPNRLCYFNKGRNLSEAPTVQCISRGGSVAAQASPNSPYMNAQLQMNLQNCVSHVPGPNEYFIYMFTCNPSPVSSNAINWPTSFAVDLNTESIIADLTPNTTSVTAVQPLFTYTLDVSSPLATPTTPPINSVYATDLVSVIAVRMEMDIDFDNKKGTGSGETYRFNQTVVLRGSRLAQEENFNG